MVRYACSCCSYCYDPTLGDPERGIPPGTPFEKAPDHWVCPWCGADKGAFYAEE